MSRRHTLPLSLIAAFTATQAVAMPQLDVFPRQPSTVDAAVLIYADVCGELAPVSEPTLRSGTGDLHWTLELRVAGNACLPGLPSARGNLYALSLPEGVVGERAVEIDVVVTDAASGQQRIQTVVIPAHVAIPPAISGTWFDPEAATQGLLITMTPANDVAVGWNTFDAGGKPVWATGAARAQNHTVTVNMHTVPEGVFSDAAPSAEILPFAALSLTYLGCGELLAAWAPDETTGLPQGHATLRQLTENASNSCNLEQLAQARGLDLVMVETQQSVVD